MLFFRRKKKPRPYPAVISEWTAEFRRMDAAYLSEQDALMLSGGILKDQAYSREMFGQALAAFLERQMTLYFEMYGKMVRTYVEENDPTYLMLMMRRYTTLYGRLFFFEQLAFLDANDRKTLAAELWGKLDTYHKDLAGYMETLSEYADPMCDVVTHIRRLMQAEKRGDLFE